MLREQSRHAMRPESVVRLVICWLPIAVVTAVIVAEIIALPFLPARVAIHWSPTGEPDGWGPAWGTVAITAAIGYGCTALFAACALFDLRSTNDEPKPRILAATTWFVVGSAVPVLGATLVRQAWQPDAPAGTSLLAALATGIACASLAAALLPSPRRDLPASSGEHLRQWNRVTVATRRGLQTMALCILVAVLAVATHVFVILEQQAWIVTAVLLVVHSAIAPAALVVVVRIDARGVFVRSPIGVPRVRIPLGVIVDADTTEVDPPAAIGRFGWNARLGPPQSGVAIRAGEGILIRLARGSRFVIATDDAAAGVAVLRAQLAAEREMLARG